jgi:hypothetical protein
MKNAFMILMFDLMIDNQQNLTLLTPMLLQPVLIGPVQPVS